MNQTPNSGDKPGRSADASATESDAAQAEAQIDDSVTAARRPQSETQVGQAGLASTGAAIGGGQAPQVGADKDDVRDRPAERKDRNA